MLQMSKRAFGMLAILAFVAVAGVLASAASANFTLDATLKCEGGTLIALCYEKESTKELFELVGEEAFIILPLPSDSSVLLTATLGESKVEISCEHTDVTEGTIVQPEPLVTNYLVLTRLTFLGCVLLGGLGEKCKVPVERTTEKLDGSPSSPSDIVFSPVTGTTFITIPFEEKNKCPATVKGEKKVTGKQLCEWANPGVDKLEHLLSCGASELLLAENAATFTADYEIEPEHLAENWDIVEIA